jgi:6-phosphogluconolactonase (cycloisomerase 2 family)
MTRHFSTASTGSGSTPTEAALGSDSKFLYVRDGQLGVVDAFRVEADGSLTPVGTTSWATQTTRLSSPISGFLHEGRGTMQRRSNDARVER